MSKGYKFVNKPGLWMVDLIELRESEYTEVNYTQGYIFIAYQPANHLIYLHFSKDKNTSSTKFAAQEMINYLDEKTKV